ncbi:hypothetical protein RhiirA5_434615 [Rhizophagus irregularis]|uniref:Uncharacterized protein n=1 Tax=Rhizophagus irregularis TaxID=588596 RepID=A0A2N0NPR5_9GLOM|nr:hypothetical protein RhiirA5_434615 [Rhizophagus irregularis]
MDIKQQKEFLVKAYHECLYQEKSLRRPISYYKDKIIEIRRKLELTEEDFEKEIRLERDLRKYERKIRGDYETLMDIKESIIKRIIKIKTELKTKKKYQNNLKV